MRCMLVFYGLDYRCIHSEFLIDTRVRVHGTSLYSRRIVENFRRDRADKVDNYLRRTILQKLVWCEAWYHGGCSSYNGVIKYQKINM